MEAREKEIMMRLSEQERRVIELLRSVDYGELRIVVNAAKPVRVEEIKKCVQL